ncbi:MAG TPA: MarC family protein [Casimicrobiaceae bacterium]|jgi:MarC family membrane protein|nr:MarC family protein [Casimicrobiaceae bacterium]
MSPDLVSAIVLLVLVTDPFGNVPLAVASLRGVPRERRARVVMRECLIAYGVLLAFLFGGQALLRLMQLSEASLSIAGGVILFLIALRMVFSHPDGVFGDAGATEPFIVPLAIPAIAGPSALATVMLMASRGTFTAVTLVIAISVAMLVMLAVLLAADRVHRVIGERGVVALERLMGLVLTALAVEMLLAGVRTFAAQLPH